MEAAGGSGDSRDAAWLLSQVQASVGQEDIEAVQEHLQRIREDFSTDWTALLAGHSDSLDDTSALAVAALRCVLQEAKQGNLNAGFSTELLSKSVIFCTSLLRVLHIVQDKRPHTDLAQDLAVAKIRHRLTADFISIASELKSCGKKLHNSKDEGHNSLAILLSEPRIKEIWQRWLRMNIVEVVKEAVGMSQMALLHSFLVSKGDCDSESVASEVNSIVHTWVEDMVRMNQIERVHEVYENMGIEPYERLRQEMRDTQDGSVRRVLGDHLHSMGKLSEDELEGMKMMERMQRMCGYLRSDEEEEEEAKLTMLTLQDVLCWSKEHWRMILAEFGFLMEDVELLREVPAETAWEYLLVHNEIIRLDGWIEARFGPEYHESNAFDAALHKLEITSDMIDSVFDVDTLDVTRNAVLCNLCRHSVFCSRESQHVSLILRRLVSSFDVTHALSDKLAIPPDLHDRLVEFYVENNLPKGLLTHLDRFHNLPDSLLENVKDKQWWVPLVLNFFAWKRGHHDSKSFVRLVRQTTKSLLGPETSEADYMESHPFVSLALSMAKGQSPKNTKIPILSRAIFSLNPQQPPLRISVYDLLKGKSAFDVSRVLRWQTAVRKPDSVAPEPPHFASTALVKQYGHREVLDYMYYLKQGRPSYAASRATIDIIQKYKSLPRQSVKEVCQMAQGLAMQRYYDHAIASGCISFLEMMGQNSLAARLNVHVANHMLSSGVPRDEIDGLMRGLVFNHLDAAAALLDMLGHTLTAPEELTCSTCIEFLQVIHKWGLAVSFARLYSLPLPEHLLKFLAKKNQWLALLLVLHIFQYPVDQAFKVVKEFSSSELQQHFHYAFLRVPPLAQESGLIAPPKMKTRDTRQTLYSKIGVKAKGDDSGSDVPSELESRSPSSADSPSDESLEGSDMHDVHYSGGDFYSVLYSCNLLPEPGKALLGNAVCMKNPVYAVMATFYESVTVTSCFCTWLYTSLVAEVQDSISSSYEEALKHYSWRPDELERLLKQALMSGHIATIVDGMQIFLTDSPLYSLSCFLLECIWKHDFDAAKVHLKAFQAGCQNLKFMASSSIESQPLHEPHWVTSVSVNLVHCTLSECLVSSSQKLHFLDLLCELSFNTLLPVEAQSADWCHLRSIQRILLDCTITVDFESLISGDYESEVNRIVRELVWTKSFATALELATLARVAKDYILVEQMKLRFIDENDHHHLQTEDSRITFWSECHKFAEDSGLAPDQAVLFFKEHASYVHTQREKFHVLQLAWKWIKVDLQGSKEEDAVEVDLWRCLLWGEMEQKYVGDLKILLGEGAFLKSEVEKARVADIYRKTLDNKVEEEALERIIDSLLKCGNVLTACRVQHMFGHHSREVELILGCMSLAEGEIQVEEFYQRHPHLSTTGSLSRERKFSVIGTRSALAIGCRRIQRSISMCETFISPRLENKRVVVALRDAVESLNSGNLCGQKILNCYKIGVSLGMDYEAVVRCLDPFSLMRKILRNESLDCRYDLARGIVVSMLINQSDLAEFLCGEIVSAITKEKHGRAEENESPKKSSELDAHFNSLINICEDPSLLGNRLMAKASSCTDGVTLPLAVELYVRSHDCYTQVCNMEGICLVLRKTRSLAETLKQEQQWGLLVRLLTGIKRYSELNYIFDILRECEQFEYLLRKGVDKHPPYKMAVLDYLKRSCPDDRELFRLVAQHFMMGKEVAEMWKSEAVIVVKQVLASNEGLKTEGSCPALANSQESSESLNVAMKNYAHAAEYYMQADKLSRAIDCANQAELLALQQYLLNLVPDGKPAYSVLSLQPKDITHLMSNVLNLAQGLILAKAYNHPVDWASILYHQVVVNGSMTFLQDFHRAMTLTGSLVEEVVKRYQKEFKLNRGMESRLKQLVSETNDLEIKYCMASQLGFKDIVQEILDLPEVTLLKDTVWKKGLPKDF